MLPSQYSQGPCIISLQQLLAKIQETWWFLLLQRGCNGHRPKSKYVHDLNHHQDHTPFAGCISLAKSKHTGQYMYTHTHIKQTKTHALTSMPARPRSHVHYTHAQAQNMHVRMSFLLGSACTLRKNRITTIHKQLALLPPRIQFII